MVRTIFSLLALGIAGALFFMYTKPAYDTVQTTRLQIAQYDAALQRASELQQIKQSLLARFNTFTEEDKSRLQKLLPDHVDNVRLILDLDNMAARHALAIQNVVVSDQQASAAQVGAAAIGASQQKYDALSLRFSTEGTYQSFLQFLLDLEQSLRLVDLVNLKITPVTQQPVVGGPIYIFEVTIRTYWLK